MGVTSSTKKSIQTDHGVRADRSSKVLFFLHRTWAVILTSKTRTLTRLYRKSEIEKDSVSEFTSQYSQYSFCSCSQCQKDDGFSSGTFSDFFDSASMAMAPNSKEAGKKEEKITYLDDNINEDKQRPPCFNSEDYAISLKRWSNISTNGGLMALYSTNSASDNEGKRSSSKGQPIRDYRNSMISTSGSDITLKQFGTVSEMLTKLKTDLRLSFPSFIQEFVADPLDGVTLLLELLRAIQLSQSNTVIHGPPGSLGTTWKVPPSLQRKALLDELACLQCLLTCCVRYPESLRKLISSSAGLFTVAVCIMSNVNKSRIIALQLLAKACDPSINGNSSVSEAMSTLRLRFGEPVRFRFLAGMMISNGGQKELLSSGLRFLNRFMDTAGSSQKRLYIQAELDQAGFDINVIKKNAAKIATAHDPLLEEIKHWEKTTINVKSLRSCLESYRKDNARLKEKIMSLEQKIKVLQDEKGLLSCVEKDLKDKCNELQSELRSLKSNRSFKGSYKKKRQDSTPNEDEGISSSERSLTPEEEGQQESIYTTYNIQDQKPVDPIINLQDEEEETTIDAVIEELKNIINDAECEDLAKKEQQKLEKEKQRLEEAQVASKLKIYIDADDYAVASESEIVPTDLHPQPPRRTKSLMQLFVPSEDYYYCPKELFFENETPYTSTDGSDSLLSASKCVFPQNVATDALALAPSQCKKISEIKSRASDKKSKRNFMTRTREGETLRQIEKPLNSEFDGSYFCSTTVNVCETMDQKNLEINRKKKCKSLDRIDGGLDSMVDIVVKKQNYEENMLLRPKSDSAKNTSLVKSVSNVYIQSEVRPKFDLYSEDKSKMFLPFVEPSARDASYFFPRVQEKRSISTSFLIKRGHFNAGMYSGQIQSNVGVLTRNRDHLALGSSRTSEKVTDLPSGLY